MLKNAFILLFLLCLVYSGYTQTRATSIFNQKNKYSLYPTITRDHQQLIWVIRWDTLIGDSKQQYNITMCAEWNDTTQYWGLPFPLYTKIPIPIHSSVIDVSMDRTVYYYIAFDPKAGNEYQLHNTGIEYIYRRKEGWSDPVKLNIKGWEHIVRSTYSNYRFSPDRNAFTFTS